MKNATNLLGSAFVLGLIALSYGASQHNAAVSVAGAVTMLISGIIGYAARKRKD